MHNQLIFGSMKSNSIYIIIILTFFLAGCITSTHIEITVLKPAEISLPPSVGTLGIIDRSIFNPPDTLLAQKIDEEADEDWFKDSEIVAKESIAGFAAVIDDSPRFDYKIIESKELEVDDFSNELDFLEWEQIINLCIEQEVDAMVTLRRVDSYDPYFLLGENTFSFSYAYFTYIHNSWRIYNPLSMKIIDEFEYVDTTYSEVDENIFKYIFSDGSPDRESKVKNASYWAGIQYGVRITPLWEDVYRKYFRWGNEKSKKAAIFIDNGNWLDAAIIWNTETENKNKKIASKACYNMALASEVMDNLKMAEYWAERSQSIQFNEDTQVYLVTLRNRMADLHKLDLQMNYE